MPSLVEIGKAGCLARGLPVLTLQGFDVVLVCLTHGSHSADKAEVG